MRATLAKNERLCSRKLIQRLFKAGERFFCDPLQVIYMPSADKAQRSHQVLFAVPAKRIRRAIDRNRIKRRLREAYRLNKQLLGPVSPSLLIAYVYQGKPQEADFGLLQQNILASFEHLYQQGILNNTPLSPA